MSNDSEKQMILKLVQSKQITPEEGARLLAALNPAKPPALAVPPPPPPLVPGRSRLLKIRAAEPSGHHVDLAVPIEGVPAVLRFAARWIPAEYQSSLTSAADALSTGYRGDLLNVVEPGGETIRIWIE